MNVNIKCNPETILAEDEDLKRVQNLAELQIMPHGAIKQDECQKGLSSARPQSSWRASETFQLNYVKYCSKHMKKSSSATPNMSQMVFCNRSPGCGFSNHMHFYVNSKRTKGSSTNQTWVKTLGQERYSFTDFHRFLHYRCTICKNKPSAWLVFCFFLLVFAMKHNKKNSSITLGEKQKTILSRMM